MALLTRSNACKTILVEWHIRRQQAMPLQQRSGKPDNTLYRAPNDDLYNIHAAQGRYFSMGRVTGAPPKNHSWDGDFAMKSSR